MTACAGGVDAVGLVARAAGGAVGDLFGPSGLEAVSAVAATSDGSGCAVLEAGGQHDGCLDRTGTADVAVPAPAWQPLERGCAGLVEVAAAVLVALQRHPLAQPDGDVAELLAVLDGRRGVALAVGVLPQ